MTTAHRPTWVAAQGAASDVGNWSTGGKTPSGILLAINVDLSTSLCVKRACSPFRIVAEWSDDLCLLTFLASLPPPQSFRASKPGSFLMGLAKPNYTEVQETRPKQRGGASEARRPRGGRRQRAPCVGREACYYLSTLR